MQVTLLKKRLTVASDWSPVSSATSVAWETPPGNERAGVDVTSSWQSHAPGETVLAERPVAAPAAEDVIVELDAVLHETLVAVALGPLEMAVVLESAEIASVESPTAPSLVDPDADSHSPSSSSDGTTSSAFLPLPAALLAVALVAVAVWAFCTASNLAADRRAASR